MTVETKYGPTPKTSPLTCPQAYSLDLYCDHDFYQHGFNEFPHSYFGRNRLEVETRATRKGWILHRRTATATCPKCASALKKDRRRG